MPQSRNELRQVFRTLLLPISVEAEDTCLELIESSLSERGLDVDEHPAWLRLEMEDWAESDTPSEELTELIGRILTAGSDDYGESIANQYFQLHQKLQRQFLLGHRQATAFLSHSLLMARLASDEFMSSAQIAKILTSRDNRVAFSRQAVDICVTSFNAKRSFAQEDVHFLFTRDEEIEELVLADASLCTSAELIGKVAIELGFPKDLNIASSLSLLAPENNLSAFTPYLQILHFQCTLAEYFDHAVTDLYEFNPRGAAAKWLFNQYPESLVSAGNPFLNNAKSVESVSFAWARSKKLRERPGASALVNILEGLESMGFLARQELSTMIRLWLHRVMRLAKPLSYELPSNLTEKQIKSVVSAMCNKDTETRGILEQRYVDALSSVIHKPEDGWRPRGLSDSVNATNISRRKLGDCDFQQTDSRLVVAYEAHGGRLTQTYVNEHIRTMQRNLIDRCDEWSGFSDPSEWRIDIIFIAHELPTTINHSLESNGVHIEIKAVTYNEFSEQLSDQTHLLADAFEKFVITPLNNRTTPNRARKKLLELAEAV